MKGPTNPPVELARYRISAGERIVRGQRIDGVVRLSDVPATGHGRAYLIERGLATKAELDGLLADYLQQAERRDAVPAVPCQIGAAA